MTTIISYFSVLSNQNTSFDLSRGADGKPVAVLSAEEIGTLTFKPEELSGLIASVQQVSGLSSCDAVTRVERVQRQIRGGPGYNLDNE